jgi:hypothetical protein
MKKLFTTISLSIAILAISWSQVVKPTRILQIKKATEEIILDASDDEASWAAATEVALDSGDVNNTEGFSATFKATWDSNYTYLFVKTIDNNPFEYDGADSWKKDGIQSYWDIKDSLQIGPPKLDRQPSIAACYGMIHETMDSYSSVYTDNTWPVFADLATDITSEGWVIEFRMPITTLYYNSTNGTTTYDACLAARTIKVNDTIGFAIQANNFNNTLSTPDRTAVVLWPGGGNTYQDPSLWGGLQLVIGTSSVKEVSAPAVNVFPNPVTNELTINYEGLQKVELLDITGKIILAQNAASNSLKVNVSSLGAGIYFIRANDRNNAMQKFLKY